MQELVTVTGMILHAEPIGEYDRRISILTKERGKIAAFAKGARRPNNRFLAATNPFSFGTFQLYEGKTSYNLMEASISNYFEELRNDFMGAYYGMYFLEIADYYTRENSDESRMLLLLYQSVKALLHNKFDNKLVKAIYEIKAIVVNGEFPGIPSSESLCDDTRYTISFIVNAGLDKLYTFNVSDEVLRELTEVATKYRKEIMEKKFKSLEILETLC